MKFTYNWLKDFVAVKILPQALADKLTAAGLEVTSLEKKAGDFVFEIEVTSNRPDLLSVIGIAREVATILGNRLLVIGGRLNRKYLQPTTYNLQPFAIKIENKKDCPLYTARIIREVKVGPSPDWLRKRLELIGCRSVNNIVDITNYVQFSWGEPLHAFDLDKLVLGFSGSRVLPLEIVIRRARNGEEITTIDGIKRVLNEEILIIAAKLARPKDSRTREPTNKAIAIAGIMGGKDAQVASSTENVLLEAAIFDPIVIRRARQKLGLQSESSYRFERGINWDIVERASLQAAGLMEELSRARCVLAKSSGKARIKKKSIKLEASYVQKILGINIAGAKIKKILNSLGLKTKLSRQSRDPDKSGKAKNNLFVEIPSYRPDLNLEIDLIEEIARIFGYGFIPKTLPKVAPQVSADATRDLVSLIKNILVGLGLNEVITYSLIDKDLLSSFDIDQDSGVIQILNPISKDQELLRPTLIPSLAVCVANNLNQRQDYVNIFEVAKVFSSTLASAKEELALGIALCGAKSYIFEQGLIKDGAGLLHLKGILEVLFERLGIKDYNFTMENASEFSICVKQEKIGLMTRLQEGVLDTLSIKNKDVFALELSLDRVLSQTQLKKKFLPLPKYPGITRDISFIIKDEISIRKILETMKEKGQPLLSDIKVVDYYKGKQIPAGCIGFTISCLYRSEERTLTEAEINPLHVQACAVLTEQFGAKIR